jgi:hypothetical protein
MFSRLKLVVNQKLPRIWEDITSQQRFEDFDEYTFESAISPRQESLKVPNGTYVALIGILQPFAGI